MYNIGDYFSILTLLIQFAIPELKEKIIQFL